MVAKRSSQDLPCRPTDFSPPRWWRSFLCGGSTGLFVYGYCFYYYFGRSDMSGFMQTSFFFGYMLMVCFGFFLMLGTIGWRSSLFFVRHIYRWVEQGQREGKRRQLRKSLQVA